MRASLFVAGIEVGLVVPQGPLEDIVLERYSPFLGAAVRPVCRLNFDALEGKAGAPNPPMAVIDGAGTTTVRIDHDDFCADVDLEGHGRLRTIENPYTVDHFFRVLFGLLTPRHRAVMLHACGVICGSTAHVFAGESGAGKSTLASLAGHRPLLSDEHVIVRQDTSGWFAASTPFWGSYARPGPARRASLSRLWELRQWPDNQTQRLDPVDALRVVLDNAVLPCSDAAIKQSVFDVAVDLVDEVPAAQLRFTPTEAVWEEIDDHVPA